MMSLLRRRMMMAAQEGETEMGWREIGTVIAENDGDALFIEGFDSERIRVTAMIAAQTDNTGLRFSISDSEYDKYALLGTSVTTILKPLLFELAVIGDYVVSTPFLTPKEIPTVNSVGAYAIAFTLPDGESTLKRFRINSASDKLITGSWLKIEEWR